MISRAEAVFQNERCDAERVEPVRDLSSLVIHRERAISAAGTNDDGGGWEIAAVGWVEGQRGRVGFFGAEGAGSAFGPEGKGTRLATHIGVLGGGQGGCEKEGGDEFHRRRRGCSSHVILSARS